MNCIYILDNYDLFKQPYHNFGNRQTKANPRNMLLPPK